jgi:hypothetical protein
MHATVTSALTRPPGKADMSTPDAAWATGTVRGTQRTVPVAQL